MGLRERVLEAIGAVDAGEMNEAITAATNEIKAQNAISIQALTADLDERVNRAYEAGFYDNGNDDPAQGEFKAGGLGYKRMSDRYVREGRIDFGRALETAWSLWQKSPIAKRVLAMKRDHIIGHNAQPDTNDDNLSPILAEFWDGNEMGHRASEFTMQLFGFGEQCFPAFVRESDGRVRLGYIDPGNIEHVIKHPENSMEDWAICAKKQGDQYTTEKMVYRIIREDESYVDEDTAAQSEYAGKLVTDKQATLEPWETEYLQKKYGKSEYDGCCFYAKVNAVSNQSRGMSDLLQVADWVDQADEVLFALADYEHIAKYFVIDVAVEGSETDVRERTKFYRDNMPKPGSVLVHNKSELITIMSPDLKQAGTIETFRSILGLILGGMGFPVHWYGFGDDANRATAVAQGDPTAKSLEHDQGLVEEMFLQMLRFVADQAEIAGGYSPPDDLEITLSLPEVSTKDVTRIATSMQALVMGLMNAESQGWVTNETAATAFAKIMAEFDIQYDVMAELEEIAAAEEEAALQKEEQTNQQLQQFLQQPPPEVGTNGQSEEYTTISNG